MHGKFGSVLRFATHLPGERQQRRRRRCLNKHCWIANWICGVLLSLQLWQRGIVENMEPLLTVSYGSTTSGCELLPLGWTHVLCVCSNFDWGTNNAICDLASWERQLDRILEKWDAKSSRYAGGFAFAVFGDLLYWFGMTVISCQILSQFHHYLRDDSGC